MPADPASPSSSRPRSHRAAGISLEQQHLLQDTVLFAANAQIPHIIKNMILVGVCALFFFLAPSVCRITNHKETAEGYR